MTQHPPEADHLQAVSSQMDLLSMLAHCLLLSDQPGCRACVTCNRLLSLYHRAQTGELRTLSAWHAHLSVMETRMPAEDCGVASPAFLGSTLSYTASATSADAPARAC
jgi:hypothetical protein